MKKIKHRQKVARTKLGIPKPPSTKNSVVSVVTITGNKKSFGRQATITKSVSNMSLSYKVDDLRSSVESEQKLKEAMLGAQRSSGKFQYTYLKI